MVHSPPRHSPLPTSSPGAQDADDDDGAENDETGKQRVFDQLHAVVAFLRPCLPDVSHTSVIGSSVQSGCLSPSFSFDPGQWVRKVEPLYRAIG